MTIRQFLFFPFLVLLTGVSSCKKDTQPAPFQLVISPKFGSESLALNTLYTLSNNQRIRISTVQFYLSDVYAVRANGERVLISRVSLCDVSKPSTCTISAELQGDFSGLEYRLGLSPELNNTDPLAVPSSDPLAESKNMYWAWLKYIFFKVEGLADISGTGTGNPTQSVSYHVGGDAYAVTKMVSRNFSVQQGTTTMLTLQLDLKNLFDNNPDALNLTTENQTDTDNRPDVAARFSTLFGESFILP